LWTIILAFKVFLRPYKATITILIRFICEFRPKRFHKIDSRLPSGEMSRGADSWRRVAVSCSSSLSSADVWPWRRFDATFEASLPSSRLSGGQSDIWFKILIKLKIKLTVDI
jgi:hypothetical protein